MYWLYHRKINTKDNNCLVKVTCDVHFVASWHHNRTSHISGIFKEKLNCSNSRLLLILKTFLTPKISLIMSPKTFSSNGTVLTYSNNTI